MPIKTRTIHLYQAADAEGSYAIRLVGDRTDAWRAQTGFGQNFDRVWSLELQSDELPDPLEIDWEAVLTSAIQAQTLSDPVIADFQWPLRQRA